MTDLKTDCRHFRWDRPCAPHKATGVTCSTCGDHEPMGARVLIVKLAATGDVLRTTALLPAVRREWPAARITWITRRAARGLFAGNDHVDEVLVTDDAATAARLAVEQFDVVLCPDTDPETVVLAAAARARVRRGFTMDAGGRVRALCAAADHWLRMGVLDPLKRQNRATYQTLVAAALQLDPTAIAEPILVPSEDDAAAARSWRSRTGFAGPLVGLNTGAGGRWLHKQWTLDHQHAFLRDVCARGAGVVLLGGPEERERHHVLMRDADGLPVFDAGTDNSYTRFAALVDQCAAVVTGDTFALHVACARRKPAIVLFGPTSSAEIELYGRGEKIVPEGLGCLVCYLPTCDVKPHCMALITPQRVVDAVARWLPPASAGSGASTGSEASTASAGSGSTAAADAGSMAYGPSAGASAAAAGPSG